MHADAALNEVVRRALNQHTDLDGPANLLIMPNLDAANIAVGLLRMLSEAVLIGPIISGAAQSAHIATPSTQVKGIFNLSAIAAADVWRCRAIEKQACLN